ncbi:alpha-amylase family glycosyl hydrolase [Ancylomarina sp. 16SWW S1-10-2]|uniref:alpha-amylase family glycosyl hydrolase n=1 Tax=Ancylomarina sp. 16SWW S1-10-2 TaxID=2499681 RepID=UPI0012AE96F1|nr:alpha-amylase family glycosyl hydrolase [Ancylomarina sp. 16SWW S1-10-2]MRT93682.1 T9SS type A sorting domain-containing protein [Ancylomarina sp. 16SWW S1-10-2]
MKKLYIYLLSFLLLIPSIGIGQITTVPEFPNVDSEITITFDSSKESSLDYFTGDLYAHTGVFIEGSTSWQHVIGDWGDNTAQPQLTNNNDGTYTLIITPNITDYYSITNGEVVTDLALVLRSSDGTKQTADLSIPIYQEGLNVSFTTPTDGQVVALNETLNIEVKASENETLTLYIDGELETTNNLSEISAEITPTEAGYHKLVAVAGTGTKEARDTIQFYVRANTPTVTKPNNIKDGINYINDTSVTLSIYAPNKDYIFVIGDFNDWELNNNYLMNQDGDYFWITLDNLTAGKEYIFQYLIDGDIRIADPYADKILDPWNDSYISDSTYPDLISYPSDKTTEIASVFQTAQTAYTWSDSEFTSPKKEDLVVYELHIRDFTDAGNIKTVKDTLDYLERLGVNAIELMPFNEFEGNSSWGYNPSFYFAPDKAYGTKADYKDFIAECHSRGIAVFMDMVLNHSYGQSPFLRMYFDGTNPTENNPWYNVTSNFSNPDAQWGYDFNHESEQTQNLVDSINSYWMSEYHIDGFRFDFTKGFSNTAYGASSWGSAYDADRIAILKRMSDEIWARKSDAVVIFEHLSDNNEETELANHGILMWGNANYTYSQATMGYDDSDLSWTSWHERGWDESNIVNYMESHDEERMMYRNLTYGDSQDDYDVTDLSTALSRVEAAGAIFFSTPGPKMIWQFEELGYDISIDYNDRVGEKPTHWEYQYMPNRKRLYDVFSALINLKKEEIAFESEDFTLVTSTALKRIEINHSDMDVRVIANFDLENGNIDPNFSQTGTWYDYFSGEELTITDKNAEIELEAGEYHIYTTKQLTTPDVATAPVASKVSVSGVYKENEILTATYTYTDANDDLEGGSIYQWYRADDAEGKNETTITDANQLSYTLGADDRNKFIRFSITPVALTGDFLTGEIVYSAYSEEIISLVNPPVASDLSISGNFTEDEILTANYTYFDMESDTEGNSIFQWYRAEDAEGSNEEAIQSATNINYTLSSDDRYKFIRFSVTPIAQTGDLLTGDIVYSPYTTSIVSLANPPVASNLAINGELIQDAMLTASYIYTDTEGDLEDSPIIQWYVADDESGTNETAIAGATSREYTISREDVGRYIRFSVTPIAKSGDLLTGSKVYSSYTQEIGYATGIEDVLDEELRIYPNPVQDLLYLDNLNQVKQINIYNLTGRMILHKNTPDANEVLNIRHLNQGIYILILDLEDGSRLTKKIIKQ